MLLGHLVVGLAEARELVLTDDRHALVEVAVGEPFGDVGGLPDRPHHLPRHDAGDAGEQEQQDQACHDQRALDQPERALLRIQREEQVEFELAVGGAHRLAHDQRRHVGAAVDQRHVLERERAARDLVAQVARHVPDRAGRDAAGTLAPRARQHRAELPRRRRRRGVGRAGVREAVEGVVERARRTLAVGVDARELAFEDQPAGVGAVDRVELLALGDPLRDLRLQHQAEHDHDGRGEGQGADHDADLQGAAPDGVERLAEVQAGLAELAERPTACGGAEPHGITGGRPCTPRRARSAPPRGAPGRARPSSAAAGRAR